MYKTILVTGGTGYIGSHTVVELLNNNYEVVIVDNLSNSNEDVITGIEKITGKKVVFENKDICDFEQLKETFSKYKPSAVIHFAAFKAVGESVQKPLKYYENNLLGLITILKLMIMFNTEHIVFSSSCTVYGEPDYLPVDEKAPIKKAISPYGNTKQISEEIISETVFAEPNLNAICLRYFNPIGAHESALIGELPIGPPNNLVPFITQTAIGIRKKLSVFGSDYNTSDGTCIRDYIHVVDLAKAHVISISRLLQKSNKERFEVFNLGAGNGNTVLEVIDAFQKSTSQTVNYEIVDRRPGDIEKVYASCELANNELGWKAEQSLEQMLVSSWNWEKYYRNNQK